MYYTGSGCHSKYVIIFVIKLYIYIYIAPFLVEIILVML